MYETGYDAAYESEHVTGWETGYEANFEAGYDSEAEGGFGYEATQTYQSFQTSASAADAASVQASAFQPHGVAETYQPEAGHPTAHTAPEAVHSRESHRAVYGITIPPAATQAVPARRDAPMPDTPPDLASEPFASPHPHTQPRQQPPHQPHPSPQHFASPRQQMPSQFSSPPQSAFATAAHPGTGAQTPFGLGHLPSSRTFAASELYPAELRPMLTRHRLRRRRHRTAASMLTGAALAFGVSALRPWSALTPGSPASVRGPTDPAAQARMPAIPVAPAMRPSIGLSGVQRQI